MKTEEFNRLWNNKCEEELLPNGFISIGSSYITISDKTVFQYKKYNHRSFFHGFSYGFTHTNFAIWKNEYPEKWPLNWEQLCYLFSIDTIQNVRLKKLEKDLILSAEYSNGKRDFFDDFPEYDLSKKSDKEIINFIDQSVRIAKINGKALCEKITLKTTKKVLEENAKESFIMNIWLEQLKNCT